MTLLQKIINTIIFLLVTGGSLAVVMYCGTHEPPKESK